MTPDPYTAHTRLCDDGVVRQGAMHHGTDYACTGHAHVGADHIRCTSPAHAVPDYDALKTAITRPSPLALWQQAKGDGDEYRRLLREHGHLVDRQPGDDGNLPCGWPGNRVAAEHSRPEADR